MKDILIFETKLKVNRDSLYRIKNLVYPAPIPK